MSIFYPRCTTNGIPNIDLQTLPSYVISTIHVHVIQLRSRRVVNDKPKLSVVIREENEEEEDSNEVMNDVIL